MTEPTTYESRTDLVRAALGCLLRGLATQRAFFASLEQRSDDTAAGLVRALESAHGEGEFEAALDDASLDVALVVDAARELERNLKSWAVSLSGSLNAVDAAEDARE